MQAEMCCDCKADVQLISIFSHLKLWLATANHNFKWLKMNNICLI